MTTGYSQAKCPAERLAERARKRENRRLLAIAEMPGKIERLRDLLTEVTPYLDYHRCPSDLVNRIFEGIEELKMIGEDLT